MKIKKQILNLIRLKLHYLNNYAIFDNSQLFNKS